MPEPERHDEGPPDDRPTGPASWGRPVALAASMLILGFVGGWILRGDDGPVTVVPAATTTDSANADTTAGGGGAGGDTTPTVPSTTPTDTTGTAPDTTTAPAPPPPTRDTIALVVLNGTDTAGLAGQNATTAEGLGYTNVATGNAPTETGPSVVYFKPGEEAAAGIVAQDFQITDVQALPDSGPLATAVPGGAQVALVLGPG